MGPFLPTAFYFPSKAHMAEVVANSHISFLCSLCGWRHCLRRSSRDFFVPAGLFAAKLRDFFCAGGIGCTKLGKRMGNEEKRFENFTFADNTASYAGYSNFL